MTKAKSVRIPEELDLFVKALAEKMNKSYSEVILGCIQAAMEDDRKIVEKENPMEVYCRITEAHNQIVREHPEIDSSVLEEGVHALWQL